MPKEQPRLKYTLDEIFGALPVSPDEVGISRTSGTVLDPNWTGPFKEFSLGLQNSRETILANMIAKKTQGTSITLGEFLDFLHTSQMRLFDFIVRVIDRVTPRQECEVKKA